MLKLPCPSQKAEEGLWCQEKRCWLQLKTTELDDCLHMTDRSSEKLGVSLKDPQLEAGRTWTQHLAPNFLQRFLTNSAIEYLRFLCNVLRPGKWYSESLISCCVTFKKFLRIIVASQCCASFIIQQSESAVCVHAQVLSCVQLFPVS